MRIIVGYALVVAFSFVVFMTAYSLFMKPEIEEFAATMREVTDVLEGLR